MTAGYADLVSDDEMGASAAAELLGVSPDTMRAMIRGGKIPARRTRLGGAYVLKAADVEQARITRAAGLRAGRVMLSEKDRAELREVRDAEAAAIAAEALAVAALRALVAELGREKRGTRAMADVLGVDRSTVQAILRDAHVPVVHHRYHTELTGLDRQNLSRAQVAIAKAKATVDKAHAARERLTRTLLERGGYGVASEVAHELGRHRSRLLSRRGKRRRQG
jgi:excisionase family DNA binding protein